MLMSKKNFFNFIYSFIPQKNLIAEIPYYLDFKYILNQSDAGKKSSKIFKK